EDEQRSAIRDLCAAHEIDQASLCRELIMSWDDVRHLNADPLVTIGAHTAAHYAIAKLPPARARQEMTEGAERIAAELGERPEHLSYPYGDPSSAGPRDFAMADELGFKTAVTTRKGVLFADHGSHMTALPRVSLNGAYQSLIYTQLYMSGAPFALWNRFRKVNAA
ncbi:MAG: polysaccharide deacetylase family protein, partial [Hyphomicrobiales bacterium]|nr:polysaccharide deacetylase family protein [Hyphomicrobiales bacterium]